MADSLGTAYDIVNSCSKPDEATDSRGTAYDVVDSWCAAQEVADAGVQVTD